MADRLSGRIDLETASLYCAHCGSEQPARRLGMLGISPFRAPLVSQVYRCGGCSRLIAPSERPHRRAA